MAQFRSMFMLIIFQILACRFACAQSENVNDVKFKELSQFVLKTFNDRPDKSVYSYNSAEVLQANKQNNSETEYYLKLKFSVSCYPDIVSEAECFPKDLICEVIVSEDPITGSRSIFENGTKCVLPTHEEDFPTNKNSMSDTMPDKNDGDENTKAVLESMPPFLLKHNIEHMMAIAEEPTVGTSEDERMIAEEDPAFEKVVSTEAAEPEAVEELIVQKKEHCTGCITDINTDLPELQEFTDEALSMIDENLNGIYKHNLIRITKAQKQVVNGIKYSLTLEIAETYCLKSSGQDRETCEPNLTSAKTCVVEFIVKPWRFSRNIISNNCTDENNEQDNNVPNFESEIVPDFTNMIESQFGREITPNVDSEAKPFFQSKSESDRKGIFDYLDEMDQPDSLKAPNVQIKNTPAVSFNEPQNEDLDFEDIEIEADDQPNIDFKGEEKKLEKDATGDNEQSRKSEEQDSSSESKEEREHHIKDSSSESKDDSDESDEKVTPIVTDDGFIGGVFRRKREIRSGNHAIGWKNIAETEKSLVHELAELAVQTLDEIDADDSKRIVLDILDAKKQFVDGVMYYLKIRVGSTSCEENKPTSNSCLQDQIATPKLCTVQLHRSFAVDSPNDIKVVKSECTNEPRGRHRRSGRKLLGGYEAANISDPYIQSIASFALSELDKSSNSLFQQSIVRIVEAQQQVVSGMNIRLTLELSDTTCRKGGDHSEPCLCEGDCQVTQVCHIQIWDQPWLKRRVVTNSSCEAKESRVARSTQLRGAPSEISVTDPHVQDVAKFALAHLEGLSNTANAQKIVKVVHATKQVVSGHKYVLTLELGESTCPKGQDVDLSSCDLKEGSVNQICQISVWEQAWLNKREVTNSSCEAKVERSRRSTEENLIGGPQKAEVDDPMIQQAAKFALAHLDGISNAAYAQKIVKIVHATKQVVGGMKYQLTMELGYSTCRKGQEVDSNSCNLKQDSNNQICYVTIFTRPWVNETRVLNATCSPAPAVKKRSLIGGGSHDINSGLFNDFLMKHKKSYPDKVEYKRRFRIFRANMKKVQLLRQTEQGTAKYGATRFADLTTKEFKKLYLGLRQDLKIHNKPALPMATIPDITLPPEFDWRNYNAVTPVKNQGMCGSCWAFSVTGNVEGQWALRHKELLSLSEQELVDCDKLDDGCKGGLPENAYNAITSLGGLETEKDYPYEGDDETCHFNKSEVKVTVTGGINITSNETKMAQWLVKNGPISIGINANAMQFYMGGVSHPWKMLCDGADLDHGVLIVGFGVHNYPLFKKTLPFWIIKNSWGESWGEQGYYRVYRGDGTCGVNQMATSAVIA